MATEKANAPSPQIKELSQGVIIVLSGGPVDWTNPPEVLSRMDQIITDVNADPWVLSNTAGKGLMVRLLPDQQTNHIHQAKWPDLCNAPALKTASPIVIVGHSNGGAAAMDLTRYLETQGRTVDLLFTADSVLTLNDNGDPYEVPANVKLNLNTYSIPVFPVWLVLPFPFGQTNHRKLGGALDDILNIGLQFSEPGAIEHRDVFYAPAGGDVQGTTYEYPELIRDSVLSVLQGDSNGSVMDLAKSYLQTLANEARIRIVLESTGLSQTLQPAGAEAANALPVVDQTSDRIAGLHKQMAALEQTRLTLATETK
jgi:hypothetical protein